MISETMLNGYSSLADSSEKTVVYMGLTSMLASLKCAGYNRIKYGDKALSTLDGMQNAFIAVKKTPNAFLLYKFLYKSFVERLKLTFGFHSEYFKIVKGTDSCVSTGLLEKEFPNMPKYSLYEQIFLIK